MVCRTNGLDDGVKLGSKHSGGIDSRANQIHVSGAALQSLNCNATLTVGVFHKKKSTLIDDG